MWTRRTFLARTGLGVLGLGGLPLGRPGNLCRAFEPLPDGSASKGLVTASAQKAIDNGLRYLKNEQAGRNRADGAFGTDKLAGNVAVTSLAALAFMASGSQPGRGPHGRNVTDALRYVLSQSRREGNHEGYLNNPGASPHGPMYSHGFGTLFLGEVNGMVQEPALRRDVSDKLHKAVKLILDAQNNEGGWRYYPTPPIKADISVTVCQMMALRSAYNAGVNLGQDWRSRSVNYVLNSQDRLQGWFKYMLDGTGGGGGQQSFARTAAGVAALNGAGYYRNSETPDKPANATQEQLAEWDRECKRIEAAREAIQKGLDFLVRFRPANAAAHPDFFYFYGQYYAVQAMWTAGKKTTEGEKNPERDYWRDWYPTIRDELLATQLSDGSWHDPLCRHYGTAMACIILQVPNNYLPILQK
jgi:hypothetical protein